jgi:hypothetical protein
MWGRGEWRVTANEYGVSFGDDESVLLVDYGNGCTTLGVYWKPLNYTLKLESHMLCELYTNKIVTIPQL